MKKYLLKRIGLSLISILIVVFAVMFLIYRVIDRESIFNQDTTYAKLSGNTRELYRYNQLEKYDYLKQERFTDFLSKKYNNEITAPGYVKAKESISSEAIYRYFDAEINEGKTSTISKTKLTVRLNSTYVEKIGNEDVKEFYDLYRKKGYYIAFIVPEYSSFRGRMKEEGLILAINEYNTFERLGIFLSKLIRFETIYDVKDENLAREDRYIRWEWDPYSNMPALVGSGTTHKYLIYFDGHFPFIHQNIIHIRLGTSNVTSKGYEFSEILSQGTGTTNMIDQVTPATYAAGSTETTNTARDFHTVTYQTNIDSQTEAIYGKGNHYINAESFMTGFTKIGNSFIIGIISTIFAYIIGLPLGILMARKKGKIPDHLGMGLIIFISAVPTLAYIFMFAGIGVKVFSLPYNWALAGGSALAFILPVISLAMPQLTGQMKWTRRFMLDQQNADYVKFAKSQGLSEREIFSKHIFRNAFIYLVHDIPAAIITSLTGAIITERVYAIPGVGGLLTNAINDYDNTLIVAVTIFYTFLSIIALLLGDLLLAKYDPRVSFTNEKG